MTIVSSNCFICCSNKGYPFTMEQFRSPIVDFWTSFTPVVSNIPSQDSYQPKAEPTDGNPDCFEIETYYDSYIDGNQPPCYVKSEYPFWWGPQVYSFAYPCVKSDDDPLDQNINNHNYCESTPFCYSEESRSGSVAQEVVVYTIDGSSHYTFEQQTEPISTQNPPSPRQLNMDEPSGSRIIKQDLPELVANHEPPPLKVVSKKASSSNLPLKKRRIRLGHQNSTGSLVCPVCDRAFNQTNHLTQHFNVQHLGPLAQRCELCGKRYRLAEDLEKHRLRHREQNKPFQCEFCPKKFNYRYDMIRHIQSRHTEAPFKCRFCGKGFARYDHLLSHENSKHRCKNKRTIAKELVKKAKQKQKEKEKREKEAEVKQEKEAKLKREKEEKALRKKTVKSERVSVDGNVKSKINVKK